MELSIEAREAGPRFVPSARLDCRPDSSDERWSQGISSAHSKNIQNKFYIAFLHHFKVSLVDPAELTGPVFRLWRFFSPKIPGESSVDHPVTSGWVWVKPEGCTETVKLSGTLQTSALLTMKWNHFQFHFNVYTYKITKSKYCNVLGRQVLQIDSERTHRMNTGINKHRRGQSRKPKAGSPGLMHHYAYIYVYIYIHIYIYIW